MINPDDYLVAPGAAVRLADHDPAANPDGTDKRAMRERLAATVGRIAGLQESLWAEGRRALLVVLQGMDTSGKDGLIRDVFSGVNPQGCSVHSFKAPTARELAQDYLWRVHALTPPRGRIGVFNRSHYEDVLVVRVRSLVPEGQWRQRYRQINDFERHLTENGTTILKFFLHISKQEQRERLQARIDNPAKWWKMSPADLEERKLWDEYERAYEEALSRCSTEHAPWHIIPADRKWARNAVAAEIILRTLERMDPKCPEVDFDPRSLTIDD